MKKIVLLALCLYCIAATAQVVSADGPTKTQAIKTQAIDSIAATAQDVVSLVVSADGPTKTQAIDNALRSAIEQTFGTFVSANTQILNDELVKDEIVTVSSGNIQKYNELATVTLPNGNTSVTLNVTVSISKLVSYAQSKGSECEFAGATFGANLRLYELHKKNERIAIENMIKQLDALRPAFEYEIKVSDPVLNNDGKTARVNIQVNVKANEKTELFNGIIANTLKALVLSEDAAKPMIEAGFKMIPYQIHIGERDDLIVYEPGYGTGDGWRFKQAGKYYLYNELPQKAGTIVAESIFDFAITDNTGGRYCIDFGIGLNSWFKGHLGYMFEIEDNRWYNKGIKDSFGTYIHGGGIREELSGVIIVYLDEIQAIISELSFDVPTEHIALIKKIEIKPSRINSTNTFIKSDRYYLDTKYRK